MQRGRKENHADGDAVAFGMRERAGDGANAGSGASNLATERTLAAEY